MDDERKPLDTLDCGEARTVLIRLLRDHPDLRAEAELLADEILSTVDPGEVAGDLGLSLELLRVEDVYERSGPQRDGGYVDPSEAAWELLETAVEPFLDDVRRRAARGRLETAGAVAMGVLMALHSCPDDAPEGSAFHLADGFPLSQAQRVMDLVRKLNAKLPADAAQLLPKWSGLVDQATRSGVVRPPSEDR